MSKKYRIAVHKKGLNYGEPGQYVETIERVLHAECIGNFNPMFCRYRNDKRVLVKSLLGDLSDPFRRTQEYATQLYIEI